MFKLKSVLSNSIPLIRGNDIKLILRHLHGLPENQMHQTRSHINRDLLTGSVLRPSGSQIQAVRGVYGHCRIGNRDVVGFGINGSYNYKDDVHFPFPAVRFKENTQEIIVKSLSSNSFISSLNLKQIFANLHTISGNVTPKSLKGTLANREPLAWGILRQVRGIYGNCRIGNRDVVGFGINGSNNYKDDVHFPFPAVRFMENSRYIIALREKEKGDWKMLCCEEKKALYRASFCQTFAEFQHPTGSWKLILGWVMFFLSFTCWVHVFYHYYVWDEPLPESFSPASQRAQLRRMIEIHVNPIDGLTSKWDYDNDCWKSQRPPTPEERMTNQGI